MTPTSSPIPSRPQVRRHAAPGALPSQLGRGAARPDAAAASAAALRRRGDAARALRVGRGCHDGLLRGEHGETKKKTKNGCGDVWIRRLKLMKVRDCEIDDEIDVNYADYTYGMGCI